MGTGGQCKGYPYDLPLTEGITLSPGEFYYKRGDKTSAALAVHDQSEGESSYSICDADGRTTERHYATGTTVYIVDELPCPHEMI